MSQLAKNDLFNHGLGAGGGNGIGSHMLIYRSHYGNEATTYPIIILKYYQTIMKGNRFDEISVVDASTGEVITAKPELVGEDAIRMVTANGRPLEYSYTYAVNIPQGALKDKRELELTSGYHYTFTVDENHTVVYEVTNDMTGEEINKIIDTVYEENKIKDNLIIDLPAGTVNLGGTPIKYRDGTVLRGHGTILENNIGMASLEPLAMREYHLTMSGVNIPSAFNAVVGANMDLKDCTVGVIDSEGIQYDPEVQSIMSFDSCNIGTNNSITWNIKATSAIEFTGCTINNAVINAEAPKVSIKRCNIDNSVILPISSSLIVHECQLHGVMFNTDEIKEFILMRGCMIELGTPLMDNAWLPDTPHYEHSIVICHNIISGNEGLQHGMVTNSGDMIPNVSFHDNIIENIPMLLDLQKTDLLDIENMEEPVIRIFNNLMTDSKMINATPELVNQVTVQIVNNTTNSPLELPSLYFRGMVNGNICTENRLTSRPDLLVSGNIVE